MRSIKKMLRKFLNRWGWDLHRYEEYTDSEKNLIKALKLAEVDLVMDIGANVGQFALGLRENGYQGVIVSFEPLSRAHAKLLLSSSHDSLWHVHPRGALGNAEGQVKINISENMASSSLLPILDICVHSAPNAVYSGEEDTPIWRLDDVAGQYLRDHQRPFLKIDTQGFEWEVLDGAEHLVAKSCGILIELSLVPLYDGQQLWRKILDRLERNGYKLWSITPAFTDHETGRTLQIDAIFLRSAIIPYHVG